MSSESVFYMTLKETIPSIGSSDRKLWNGYRLTHPGNCALKHIHKKLGDWRTPLKVLVANDRCSTIHPIRTKKESSLSRQRRIKSDRHTCCPYAKRSGMQLYQYDRAVDDINHLDRPAELDIDVEVPVNDLVVILDSLERLSKREA
jgi:hypothetical protein